MSNIAKLESAFLIVFWDSILSRFDATSQYMQKVKVDLISASKMLSSLVDFVKDLRDKFSEFENQAKQLSAFVNVEYSDLTRRKISRKLADGGVQTSNLSGSKNSELKHTMLR